LGRWYADKTDISQIYAGIYTGKERYRKHEREDDDDEAEQDRLDSFADWLGGDE
jgi:hypothetical protein